MDQKLKPSELILNDDGSVYHLHLLPENIADTIITVGDQDRAKRISKLFSTLEFETTHREFATYTGIYKSKRITVCSTGIGTDNIDIFLNELDATVNINLKERRIKTAHKSLNIIRIGTSGSVQKDVPVGSFVASEYALGTDNLAYYYGYSLGAEEKKITESVRNHFTLPQGHSKLYVVPSSSRLLATIGNSMSTGMTATATGFYAPQGRALRLKPKDNWVKDLQSFSFNKIKITNLEMETSGLYLLSRLLGHNCLSCSAILANRADHTFAEKPKEIIDNLIDMVLEKIDA
ncbi:MAG: nucleoside phosphorylase [Saprospiraceae bacterium]